MLLHIWKIDLTPEQARNIEAYTHAMVLAAPAVFFTRACGTEAVSAWSAAENATPAERDEHQALMNEIEISCLCRPGRQLPGRGS